MMGILLTSGGTRTIKGIHFFLALSLSAGRSDTKEAQMSQPEGKAKPGLPGWALLGCALRYKASELDIAAIEKKAAEDPSFEEACLRAAKSFAAFDKQMEPHNRAEREYMWRRPYISKEEAAELEKELTRLWDECYSASPPAKRQDPETGIPPVG